MDAQKKEPVFRNKYLGPLLWLLFSLVVFLFPRFAGMPMDNVAAPETLGSWLLIIMPVFSFVLVARAGGIDWSVMPIYALSSVLAANWMQSGNSTVIVQILLLGFLCGSINGILCVLCGLPSVIITLFTGTIISHLSYMFSGGMYVTLRLQNDSITVLSILCIILAIVAFFIHLITPLGRPMWKRQNAVTGERLSYFLAYAFSSMIAAATGMLSVGVLESTTPGSQILSIEFLSILLFVGCSTLFDNRVMPLIMAVIGRFLFWGFTSGYSVGNLGVGWQYFVIWGPMVLAIALDRVYLRNYAADFLHRNKLGTFWQKKMAEAEPSVVQNITADTVVINTSSDIAQNIIPETEINKEMNDNISPAKNHVTDDTTAEIHEDIPVNRDENADA